MEFYAEMESEMECRDQLVLPACGGAQGPMPCVLSSVVSNLSREAFVISTNSEA